MMDRPALPMALRRAVLVEAGHRCAIPTCKQHPVEVAHIEPREQDGSNDVFDNLIGLCPTCHDRYDRKQIDRPAMRHYKANLSVLNHRYGSFERRVLQMFADDPQAPAIVLPGGFGILLKYLIDDGLIQLAGNSGVFVTGVPSLEQFVITDKGREFINRWLGAEDLEET